MTTDYVSAKNEIFSQFFDYWSANTTAITGYVPEVWFQGQKKGSAGSEDIPTTSKYWCRCSKQTVTEEQITLRSGECGITYEDSGLVFIQLFCPESEPNSMLTGEELSVVARDAFRGKKTDGGIWFKNVRINELDPEPKWLRFNIIAEFEYTERT